MNSLHMLYLESVLHIKIGQFVSNAAEFTGQLNLETITEVCANSGVVFWQNPEAPIVDKAYLRVPFDNGQIEFAVDFNFNAIYVA